MKHIGIIPARYASTRFPGKPLALIGGKPMIQVVYEHALEAGLDLVAVATDDERIAGCIRKIGGTVVMTRPDHPSGTDRCGEAADILQLLDEDVVINIQGDEPFISRNEIELLARMFERPEVNIATLVKPLDRQEAHNTNKVKVVTSFQQKALYFSRYPIPFVRDAQDPSPAYRQHLGIYAYRCGTLRKLVRLQPSPLEKSEKLEQLRWIENDFDIFTALCNYQGTGIDTPEDLERLNMPKP